MSLSMVGATYNILKWSLLSFKNTEDSMARRDVKDKTHQGILKIEAYVLKQMPVLGK
jgi:hypothetical protein